MTKLYHLFLLSLIFVSQMAWGQTLHRAEVLNQFANSKHVRWTLPIGVETPTIEWYERQNSLSASEGIRTFAGYHDGSLLGVVSVSKGELSGSITWKGASYQILTKQDKIALVKEEDYAACGTCTGGTCEVEDKALSPKLKAMRKAIDKMAVTGEYDIYTDGVLKVYRLALLVDYGTYRSDFYADVDAVRRYWANAEAVLNELYRRDLSIKFKIVDDPRLIITDVNKQVYPSSYLLGDVMRESTGKINNLIGERNYDIGVSMAKISNVRVSGQAAMHSAFSPTNKGYAYSKRNAITLAHEIGHMFGSDHTFTEYPGGEYTMKTEPGAGTSVMSYDTDGPRDFFSLASTYYIRKGMLNNADYYTTEERITKKGPGNTDNVVYGIETTNRPPVIDRSKLKSSYTIPKGSYFQFRIPATDPDGHRLLYMAHQVDFRRHQISNAKFASRKPTESNVIVFEPRYAPAPAYYIYPYLAPESYLTGEFTFWLGVSDGGEIRIDNPQAENHATRYDMFVTKLNIVEGIPFKITSQIQKQYTAGQKVTLQWGVDTKIFDPATSKVRILMSNDFGETYKYVLAEGVPNNGSCEVTIPPIVVDAKYREANRMIGNGLFRIEVIDHIAHTISLNNPLDGRSGFEVLPASIVFQNLPEPTLTVKEGQLPKVQEVTATSSGRVIPVSYAQKETDGLVVRTWTATDNGNSIEFKQFIYVEKNKVSMQFEGVLPTDLHVQCPADVPEVPTLRVTGGTNPQVDFFQTRLNDDYYNFTLKRTWTATDANAAPISHTQLIYVNDITKPIFNRLPKDVTVRSQTNIPFQDVLSATDNCGENIRVNMYQDWKYENGVTKRLFTWVADDGRGNENRHVQTITIDPNSCEQVVDEAKAEELLASEGCVGGYTAQQLSALKTAYDTYKADVNNCDARATVINAVNALQSQNKILFDSNKYYRLYSVSTNEVLYLNYETNQVATRAISDASKVDEFWKFSAQSGSVTITNPNTQTSISANGELVSNAQVTLSSIGVAKYSIPTLLVAPQVRLKAVESIDLPITKKYATLCLPFAVEIPSSSTLTFYRVGDVSGNAVNIIPLSETIPANMPVIVRDDSNSTHKLNIAYGNTIPTATNTANGVLKGVLKPETIPADAFILWTNGNDETGFYRVESTNEKLAANRAYLLLSNAGQSYYQINITDGKSSIINIEYEVNKRVQYFDLSGRPVTVLVPGVMYLTSEGKKVIFKQK